MSAPEIVERINKLFAAGYCARRIAEKLGLHLSTVERLVKPEVRRQRREARDQELRKAVECCAGDSGAASVASSLFKVSRAMIIKALKAEKARAELQLRNERALATLKATLAKKPRSFEPGEDVVIAGEVFTIDAVKYGQPTAVRPHVARENVEVHIPLHLPGQALRRYNGRFQSLPARFL